MKYHFLRTAIAALLHCPNARWVTKATSGLLQFAPEGFIPTRHGFDIYFERTTPAATHLRQAFISGAYESEHIRMFSRLVRQGDRVVDVGAHEGYITLWLSGLVGSKGQVLAVEPNPENLRLLRMNVAHNRVENVQIAAHAASDQNGYLPFHWNPGEGAWGGLDSFSYATQRKSTLIPVDTLNAIVRSHIAGAVSLLKIDTEGHELQVLRGAAKILAEDKPHLCFEVNLTFWAHLRESVDALLDYVRGYGYTLFVLRRGHLHPWQWFDERVTNLYGFHPLKPLVGQEGQPPIHMTDWPGRVVL